MRKLLLACALLSSVSAWAQLPTSSYAVSADCPASARNPSQLYQVLQNGSMLPIGIIRSAANGNNLIVNALGYDQGNQSVLYGMRVEQQSLANFTTFVPQLYRINLATAQADSVGPMTPPTTPPSGELTPTTGDQTATDVRQTLNFVADSGPDGTYYTGGATFRIIFNTFFGIPIPNTAQVTDVRLYVGTVNLAAASAPAWRRLDTSDPATAAVVETFRSQVQAYIRSSGSGPTPEGGIQDWVFDKATGNLVSYLGLTDQYLTVRNPATAPVGTTINVASPLPAVVGSSNKDIGAMFSDRFNNVYAVRAGTGDIYRIDNLTGNYSGRSYGAALGCNRGDAVSFRDALPLPVKLVRFSAAATAEGARLSWVTASEQEVAYFEVERSLTARQWEPVLRVPAANAATGKSYSAVDARRPAGAVYYRLAMHDKSGAVAYSAVQQVAQSPELQVYPNPATSAVNVLVPAAAATVLELRDAQGRLVRQHTLAPGSTSLSLSTAGLPGGVYMLRVQQGTAARTTRLVVLAPY